MEVLSGGEGTSWGIDRTGVAGGFQSKVRDSAPIAALWKQSRVDLPPSLASGIFESAGYDVEIVGEQRWAVGIVEKEAGVYRLPSGRCDSEDTSCSGSLWSAADSRLQK